MTPFNRPDNPFPVTPTHAENTFILINCVVETCALISVPVDEKGVNVRLILNTAYEAMRRMTSEGVEDYCYALVWELSVWIQRNIKAGIPFPPYDITTDCDNPTCEVDHSGEIQLVNALFTSALQGNHQGAVKAYARHAREIGNADDWNESLQGVLALLVLHTAERVGQYRSDSTDELPPLDDPATP